MRSRTRAITAGTPMTPGTRLAERGRLPGVGSTWTVARREGERMSDEVLRLRGVGVRRDRSMLLRDVDWTAHEDERWVVIGPNGAGKTTLLQVAAAQLFPTEGTVEVLGERLGEVD